MISRKHRRWLISRLVVLIPGLGLVLSHIFHFRDVARTGGLQLALDMTRKKLSRTLQRALKRRRRQVAERSLPPDLGSVQRKGCLISVVVPVHDTPPELLETCIQSVVRQAYENWELCICDDASARPETLAALEKWRGADPRIRIVRSDENLHISRASNLAAEQATGRYLAFLDHDDVLHQHALYEVAKADLAYPDIDLLYTDEDKIDPSGAHCDAYLKPDWSPEHLDSVMYVLHMLVIRKSLFWRLGGLRDEVTGAQDYDLALRASAVARRIHHVDKVLYHWRMIPGSAATAVDAKPYALERARRALADALAARGEHGRVVDGAYEGSFRIRRTIEGDPPVTLLILTNHGRRDVEGRGEVDLLANFVTSIRTRSSYRNYRILVVDNGNASEVARNLLHREGVRLESFDYQPPFNFPRKLNFALRFVDTELVILLNDDLEVITPDWIESLIEHAHRPAIGVVGAQLLYPDERIQHAGIVLGLIGAAGHVFHGMPSTSVGYNGYSHLVRNYSAVTGAVIATRMSILRELGGFDESLAVDYNDVDFCLRVRALGLRIVYTPFCKLYHFEGSTMQRTSQNPAEVGRFSERWRSLIERDPYFNAGLSRTDARVVPDVG